MLSKYTILYIEEAACGISRHMPATCGSTYQSMTCFKSEGRRLTIIETIQRQKILRRQFPVCAGYAFTDYKSQGQTLEYVIVVGPIATRRFSVTPFAAYIALSWSHSRHRIRLLRDFKDEIYTQHPSEELRVEDERLKMLTEETARRFDAGFYNLV